MAYHPEDNGTFCATCGREQEPGTRFCPNCGAAVAGGPGYALGMNSPPAANSPPAGSIWGSGFG